MASQVSGSLTKPWNLLSLLTSIAMITQFEHCEYVYVHGLVGGVGQGA